MCCDISNFSLLIHLIATFTPICNESEVQLRDGETAYDGRVDICLNGVWHAMCGIGWDGRDALVACRQLGNEVIIIINIDS